MLFTKSASHRGHGAAVAKASGEGFWWRPDIARGRAQLGAMRGGVPEAIELKRQLGAGLSAPWLTLRRLLLC